MFHLAYTSKVAKQIRKLDKPLKQEIKRRLELIAQDPYIGQKKKGKLHDVWGYGFIWRNTAYRIAYKIYGEELVVLVLAAGSHEGFWEEISRYI